MHNRPFMGEHLERERARALQNLKTIGRLLLVIMLLTGLFGLLLGGCGFVIVPTPEPTPPPEEPVCPCGIPADNGVCPAIYCGPDPTPPPPPVLDSFEWVETSDADLCVQAVTEARADLGLTASSAAPPVFLSDVEAMTLERPPLQGESEGQWYSRLVPLCEARGLHCALYGEELAVAKVKGASENYDRLLNSGKPRTGMGSFRSRCFPATRSQALPLPGVPSDATYPAPVQRVQIKVHTPGAQRADGLALMDGVALACGPNPDFPDRQCWPACGPEGTPNRVGCDASLEPRWVGEGHSHRSNPWLWHAIPGTKVFACVGTVCSDKVEAK